MLTKHFILKHLTTSWYFEATTPFSDILLQLASLIENILTYNHLLSIILLKRTEIK